MDGQTPACACLSGMYLTISGLQAINDFGFPHVLVKIRSSCSTVYSVLNCEQCPKERGSAMSNLMLLTTLLTSIVERYERVLKEVSVATQRATETAQIIPFRWVLTLTSHLRNGRSLPAKSSRQMLLDLLHMADRAWRISSICLRLGNIDGIYGRT